MGDLIVLSRAERRPRPAPAKDASAEILFFTGVRYYRMTDEMLSEVAKPRRRRRSAGGEAVSAPRIDCRA